MTKTTNPPATVEQVHAAIEATGNAGLGRESSAKHYAYTLPENALQFDNVDAMKRAVMSSGSHYWDAAAVRTFRGRTDGYLYGRRFWVESRKFVDSDGTADMREYQVAWVSQYGDNLSVEKVGDFKTLDRARAAASSLAAAVVREAAARDAGLGVGHVWTATTCPAYTSLIGADCTCGGVR